MTKTNTYKTNKQMHEKHTNQLPLPQMRCNAVMFYATLVKYEMGVQNDDLIKCYL